MVDSHYMASLGRRYCLRSRDSGARSSDIESSELRLPEMARNASVLRCGGIFSLHQYLSWPAPATNRVFDALLSYLRILWYLNPTGLSGSSSISERGLWYIL